MCERAALTHSMSNNAPFKPPRQCRTEEEPLTLVAVLAHLVELKQACADIKEDIAAVASAIEDMEGGDTEPYDTEDEDE